VTFQLAAAGKVDPFVTLALTAPAFFVLGMALHWFFTRFSVTLLNTLLVTFGLTSIIEAGIQWFWTADFQRMESTYAAVRWKLGPLFVSLPDVVTLGLALTLSLGMWGVLRFTDLGKAIRATTEDAPIAAAFGVNERLLGYLISGVAAAVAAVAGLCLALSHTLAPVQIYAWMGVVFAAVMLGGLGSPVGPLVAGIVIGVSEALTMAVTAPTWAPLVSFSLLIAILLLRPSKF
jgi:branched-chain amino acid transport system permease protein